MSMIKDKEGTYYHLSKLLNTQHAIEVLLPDQLYENSKWDQTVDWVDKGRSDAQNYAKWENVWRDVVIAMKEVLSE